MKIGIMGGTFNPIHNAHLLIAEMAREEYGLDRVIFITDGNPPHKSANVTAKQRFEMTHIAIADNSAFEEDDFEINRSEKSYTVNTLGYLKEKYPKIYRRVEERLESGWENTIALIEQGIAEDVVRPVNIAIYKVMLEATIEQFFQRDVLVSNQISYADALDEVVGILVDGITVKC